MEEGIKARFFKILKPKFWSLRNFPFPWRSTSDRLSQLQLQEYQDLTFLKKHEIIRGQTSVPAKRSRKGPQQARAKTKYRAPYRRSQLSTRKKVLKKCQENDSNTSTNSVQHYKEEQKKVEEEIEKEIQNLASRLDRLKLEAIFVRLVKRNPGLIIDLLQDATPSCSIRAASSNIPDWCFCGLCREMPTDIEKVCCGKTEQHCISISSAMANLCLNEAVLQLMLNYRNELFGLHAFSNDSHNRELRHAAYRQYIMWHHGCLGTGNKHIIPSCCVWKIRTAFPDRKGSYSGFRPSRLS